MKHAKVQDEREVTPRNYGSASFHHFSRSPPTPLTQLAAFGKTDSLRHANSLPLQRETLNIIYVFCYELGIHYYVRICYVPCFDC